MISVGAIGSTNDADCDTINKVKQRIYSTNVPNFSIIKEGEEVGMSEKGKNKEIFEKAREIH